MIYVINDPEIKKTIREQAESIEKDFYEKKLEDNKEFMSSALKMDLNFIKPHLTVAPVLLSISTDSRYSNKHAI